ncbi:type II secretion system protein GspE [Halioglobus japonicus]|uniref:Type II secretion system protein E n=1 Tax=Halioglobus japonicus TaxID=930805 RepID=A0AAP8MEP6_9GAMM|nr:type II secretion system ATPase GspE [Halioglobus japonicus]AQA18277.1 type II secretion system protein GspE [Halioglobus japonicus]PLW86289.1 type II secretion system protein GspE [Halioglobus japonicus]GHD13576.1 type II secretion system protein GspE [Halioglobus japonicus]
MKKIGELLVEQGKLSERDVERALLAQSEMGEMFGQVLVKLGLVSELDFANVLSTQIDIPLLSASDYPEEPVQLDALAQDFMFSHHVVPLAKSDAGVSFAAAVPQDPFLAKALRMALDCPVDISLGLESDINRALQLYLQQDESEEDEVFDQFGGQSDDEFIEHLKDLASEAPVIRLVNQIIHRAVDMQASDIHIEPFEDGLHLRYRIDGVLQDHPDPPAANLSAAIASRIKLLSHMNIAEQRLPQDGRIMTRVKGHELDLRVSTIPTVHGESIVMRVLDRESIRLSLPDMGFSEDTLSKYQDLLARPHGVLLVTGPTGSGKTTTLYASLASLDSDRLKIITVEDPVEYQLQGVNQIQVQAQIELTFARALRAILRQDPDIIMIGEMRDTETAQIGVQSALTGHLVLSTLHTNTAAGAITRLEDMGVERYLITSSVNGVLAQRLVRTLCSHCKEEVPLGSADMEASGIAAFLEPGQKTVYQAVGCEHCMHTGYSGRTSIHELFPLDDEMHRVIMMGADATTLHAAARRQGMYTLYEDGLRKVAKGLTSMEEVLRVTQDQSDDVVEDVAAVESLDVEQAVI